METVKEEVEEVKPVDKDVLNLTSVYQQEQKQRMRIQKRQQRVRRDTRKLEEFIRLYEVNRYHRVYSMLAFEKTIKDIAMVGSVGNVSFELLDRPGNEKSVKMIIDHPELNSVGIVDQLERESKTELPEFTLYQALAMMDNLQVTTGKAGGIHIEVVKHLHSR